MSSLRSFFAAAFGAGFGAAASESRNSIESSRPVFFAMRCGVLEFSKTVSLTPEVPSPLKTCSGFPPSRGVPLTFSFSALHSAKEDAMACAFDSCSEVTSVEKHRDGSILLDLSEMFAKEASRATVDAKQLPTPATLCVSFTPLSATFESLVSSTDSADAPLQSSPCLRHALAIRSGASGSEDTRDSVCMCVLLEVGHAAVGESAHDGGFVSADSIGLIQVGELVDCTSNSFPCLSHGIAVNVTVSTNSPHPPATLPAAMPFQVDYVRGAEGAWVACDPLPFPTAVDSLPQRLFQVLELQWQVDPGTQYPHVAIGVVDSLPVKVKVATDSDIAAHATREVAADSNIAAHATREVAADSNIAAHATREVAADSDIAVHATTEVAADSVIAAHTTIEKGNFSFAYCPVPALLPPITDECPLGHASLHFTQSIPLGREMSIVLAASSANVSVWRLPHASSTPHGTHADDRATSLRELLFTQPMLHSMSPIISNLSDPLCFSTSPVDRDHTVAVIFLLIAVTTLAALRVLEARVGNCAVAFLAPSAAPSDVAPFAQTTAIKDADVAVLAETGYTRTAVELDITLLTTSCAPTAALAAVLLNSAHVAAACIASPEINQDTRATSFVSPVVCRLLPVVQIPPPCEQAYNRVPTQLQQPGTIGTWLEGMQQVHNSATPVTSWTAANIPSPPRLLDAACCPGSRGAPVPVALSWTSPESLRRTPGSYRVPAAPLCPPYNCARPLAIPAVNSSTEVSTSAQSSSLRDALPGQSRLLLHLHALSQPKPSCVDARVSSMSAAVHMPGLEGGGESVVAQTSVAGQRRKRVEEECGGGSVQIDDALTHGKTKARERTTAYVIRNAAAPGPPATSELQLGGASGVMQAMALESSSDSDSWSACIAPGAAECGDVVMVCPDTANHTSASGGTGARGATDWSGCFGDIFGPPEVQ